jgi:hypothetical protein
MKIAYVLYPDFTALDLVAPTTSNPRSPPARRPPPTPARSVWHYASYWGTARCRWRRGSTVRAQRRDSAALGGRSPNDGRASDTRGGCLAAWVATSGHSNTRSASRPSFLWQSEIAAVPEKRGVPGSSPGFAMRAATASMPVTGDAVRTVRVRVSPFREVPANVRLPLSHAQHLDEWLRAPEVRAQSQTKSQTPAPESHAGGPGVRVAPPCPTGHGWVRGLSRARLRRRRDRFDQPHARPSGGAGVRRAGA